MNPFDPDLIPLSYFEVECDGSACGSGPVGWHVHPEQHGREPVGRVRVTKGERVYLSEPSIMPDTATTLLLARAIESALPERTPDA